MKCSRSLFRFAGLFCPDRVASDHLRFVLSSHRQSARVQIDPISSNEGVAGSVARSPRSCSVRQFVRQPAAVAARGRRTEHLTRNEGVPGSSPGVGFRQICRRKALGLMSLRARFFGTHPCKCVFQRFGQKSAHLQAFLPLRTRKSLLAADEELSHSSRGRHCLLELADVSRRTRRRDRNASLARSVRRSSATYSRLRDGPWVSLRSYRRESP
jgi:hypothetical protein